MTLATRCPQCDTTFRIVPDQLKISEGLVRCGKCQHVFNANEHKTSGPKPLPLSRQTTSNTSPKKQTSTSTPKIEVEAEQKQNFSNLLEDSKFLDSLLSEFHIGWSDTITDPHQTKLSGFSKHAFQPQENTSLENNIEKIELTDEVDDIALFDHNTEFTESLLSFDDSEYNSQDFIVLENEETDDEVASLFFEDSLTDNFSFDSSDSLLEPKLNSQTEPTKVEKPQAVQKSVSPANKKTTSKNKPKSTTASPQVKPIDNDDDKLALIPNELAKEIEDTFRKKPRQQDTSTLLDLKDEEDEAAPVIPKFSDFATNQEDEDDFSLSEKKNERPIHLSSSSSTSTHQEKNTPLMEGKATHQTEGTFHESDVHDPTLASHFLDDGSSTQFGDSSNTASTHLNEKYEKIAASLQEQQVANLSFVKQTSSLWNTPLVKLLLLIVSLALLGLLLAQTVHYRNFLVSYIPSARPFLVTLCEPLGYTVDYPISFDLNRKVTIDASSLNSLKNGEYQLEVVIRNREAYAVAIPCLELTLENISGEVIAKRIFTPADLNISKAALNPQEDILIRRIIEVDTQGATNLGFATDLLYL